MLILHGRRICRPKPLCDAARARAIRDDCDCYSSPRGAGRQREGAAHDAPRGQTRRSAAESMTRAEFERARR